MAFPPAHCQRARAIVNAPICYVERFGKFQWASDGAMDGFRPVAIFVRGPPCYFLKKCVLADGVNKMIIPLFFIKYAR